MHEENLQIHKFQILTDLEMIPFKLHIWYLRGLMEACLVSKTHLKCWMIQLGIMGLKEKLQVACFQTGYWNVCLLAHKLP